MITPHYRWSLQPPEKSTAPPVEGSVIQLALASSVCLPSLSLDRFPALSLFLLFSVSFFFSPRHHHFARGGTLVPRPCGCCFNVEQYVVCVCLSVCVCGCSPQNRQLRVQGLLLVVCLFVCMFVCLSVHKDARGKISIPLMLHACRTV